MQQNFKYTPNEFEQVLIDNMRVALREDLYGVMKLFKVPDYELLDTAFKYELIDDELSFFVPSEILNQGNVLCYRV